MDLTIHLQIVPSKRKYRWANWFRFCPKRYSKPPFSLQRFEAININPKRSTKLVTDFGSLEESVNRYQPNFKKSFLILEKLPRLDDLNEGENTQITV